MLKIRKKNIKVFKNLLSWWCVSWCSVCKFLHSGPDVAEKKLVSVNRYYARRTWSHFGEETVERSRDGGRFRNGFQSFKFDNNCKQTADLEHCLHLYVCKPCLFKKRPYMKSRNSTYFCGNFYGCHFSTKNPFELHAIAMKLKCMKIRTFQRLCP